MNNQFRIKNKKILITGGTGSFGSTMVRSLLEYDPLEIVIFSRDELKQFEMRNKYNNSNLRFIIGDVRDYNSVRSAMVDIDYVFHAAALKQVPSCEFFPLQAIQTNVLGGQNVMKAALEEGVKRVVVLSTDKAVYPINAMGMTKALMEKIMVASSFEADRRGLNTILCGVRYGNVLYSRGSVIPYFVELIKQKKKLQITNPSMTRFLLPLSDSVELVLHALTEGEPGAIYVKKAPAADIKTLAEAVSKIYGYSQGIEVIGVRAGEKFHESLISREEWIRAEDQKDFYCIPPETQTLEYSEYFFKGKQPAEFNEGYTSFNTKRLTLKETVDLLMKLPEINESLKQFKTNKSNA